MSYKSQKRNEATACCVVKPHFSFFFVVLRTARIICFSCSLTFGKSYSYFIDFAGVMCDTRKLGPMNTNRHINSVDTLTRSIAGILNSTGT